MSTIIYLEQMLSQSEHSERFHHSTMPTVRANEMCQCSNACVLFHSEYGCAKSERCEFCHLSHDVDIDFTRPRRARRLKLRDRLSQYLRRHKPDQPEVHASLQAEAQRHPYARFVIKGILHVLASRRASSTSQELFWL
ncbi:unnamed protein product [Durusdinium trenchii]|uniref:C3H1-type domain-containing protein n=1 Tax=Durusdinium trenchii TaxID=1381693 RepID=A0ABP0R0N8_9DINO